MSRVRSGVPEIDKLFRKIRKQGGTIERGGSHWKVFGPHGEGPVIITSSKPKHRALKNAEGHLRKAGILH